MDQIQAIALGIMQGLTEFIPVSSSGHLSIIPYLLGWETPSLIFDIAVHTGTLIALLFYFRTKLWGYLKSIIVLAKRAEQTKTDQGNIRSMLYVGIATIPATIIGFLLRNVIEEVYKTGDEQQATLAITYTCIALIVVGLGFIGVDYFVKRERIQSISKMGLPRAVLIGFAQAAALFRGVSRSGATVITGRLAGMRLVDAAEFSFLMSIPILVLTTAYGVLQLLELDIAQLTDQINLAIIGAISAALSGFLAIKYMLNYLRSNGLSVFGWYRIVFGAFILFVIYGV